LKDLISQHVTKIAQLEKDIQLTFEKHSRIRSNMSELGSDDSSNHLRARYVSELDADETKLTNVQAEIKQLSEEKFSLQEELESIVGRISVPVTKLVTK
jgi:predicted  nucleic acid-binding Zn-ribbon protein